MSHDRHAFITHRNLDLVLLAAVERRLQPFVRRPWSDASAALHSDLRAGRDERWSYGAWLICPRRPKRRGVLFYDPDFPGRLPMRPGELYVDENDILQAVPAAVPKDRATLGVTQTFRTLARLEVPRVRLGGRDVACWVQGRWRVASLKARGGHDDLFAMAAIRDAGLPLPLGLTLDDVAFLAYGVRGLGCCDRRQPTTTELEQIQREVPHTPIAA